MDEGCCSLIQYKATKCKKMHQRSTSTLCSDGFVKDGAAFVSEY